MTDAEAIELADLTDWWIPSTPGPLPMRTLREALQDAGGREGRMSLFRPGGFGKPAIWLSAEEIVQLRTLLDAGAPAGWAAQAGSQRRL